VLADDRLLSIGDVLLIDDKKQLVRRHVRGMHSAANRPATQLCVPAIVIHSDDDRLVNTVGSALVTVTPTR